MSGRSEMMVGPRQDSASQCLHGAAPLVGGTSRRECAIYRAAVGGRMRSSQTARHLNLPLHILVAEQTMCPSRDVQTLYEGGCPPVSKPCWPGNPAYGSSGAPIRVARRSPPPVACGVSEDVA
jgi:hypothetical protein